MFRIYRYTLFDPGIPRMQMPKTGPQPTPTGVCPTPSDLFKCLPDSPRTLVRVCEPIFEIVASQSRDTGSHSGGRRMQ